MYVKWPPFFLKKKLNIVHILIRYGSMIDIVFDKILQMDITELKHYNVGILGHIKSHFN